jgi:hypothetical protein
MKTFRFIPVKSGSWIVLGIILIAFLTLTIPAVSGADTTENKELQNCLCACLEPPGGQFSCGYDTEDKGWSPSCRDLSNGPCICKAYGCFRGPLPTDGECYNKCYEQVGAGTTQTAAKPEIDYQNPGYNHLKFGARYLATDKGTNIAVWKYPKQKVSKENLLEISKNFPSVKMVEDLEGDNLYNCISYVFIPRKPGEKPSLWIQPDEVEKILEENNYKKLGAGETARHNDIIVYYMNGRIGHAAIIFVDDRGNVMAKGKFGDGPVGIHELGDKNVISNFGQPQIYRRGR